MATIIAGRFEQQEQAEHAVAELVRAGFGKDRIASFFINPPGQHDQYPIGGDEDESPGAHDAKSSAMIGAAAGTGIGLAAGLVTLPLLGPGAAIAGVGACAYIGSLVGALNEMNHTGASNESGDNPSDHEMTNNQVLVRKSGMMVAVQVPESDQQDNVVHILRGLGATDLERTDGTVRAGQWQDFDPLKPIALLEGHA